MTLHALTIGAGAGFLSSTPIGPINVWLFGLSLVRGHSAAVPFALGVVAADLLVAGSALWGIHEALSHSVHTPAILYACSLIFVFMGAMLLLRPSTANITGASHLQPRMENSWRQAAYGFAMCALNPGFLIFWSSAIGTLQGSWLTNPNLTDRGAFLLGVAAGDGVWFALVIAAARYWRQRSPERWMGTLQRVVGACMVAAGIWAAAKGFTK